MEITESELDSRELRKLENQDADRNMDLNKAFKNKRNQNKEIEVEKISVK